VCRKDFNIVENEIRSLILWWRLVLAGTRQPSLQSDSVESESSSSQLSLGDGQVTMLQMSRQFFWGLLPNYMSVSHFILHYNEVKSLSSPNCRVLCILVHIIGMSYVSCECHSVVHSSVTVSSSHVIVVSSPLLSCRNVIPAVPLSSRHKGKKW